MILGKIDTKAFEKFQEQLYKLKEQELPRFFEESLKELMGRLLEKVIPRTPVGQYGPKEVHFFTKEGKEVRFTANPSKTGGTLRAGWTVGAVKKVGNVYKIEIFNPIHYAPYVEYGHRTPDHTGWVEGQFMLTVSEDEIQENLPAILQNKLERFLEGIMND